MEWIDVDIEYFAKPYIAPDEKMRKLKAEK
jgi:hypothetical protein